MLDAGRPPQRIAGLSVFFDHADPQRRYVLADAPRLVADPLPRLSLLLFRGDAAGGLLDFEAELAPTAAQLADVERSLMASGRRPTLARPDWRNGSVGIAGWLRAAELAPRLLAAGAPSLVGDPSVLVAARLDATGAALAAAALRGNALPTVLIFELDFLGLAGPLGVEVEADLVALHDRLTAEAALTTPYGRARIAKTWESAARDNLIRVHVVDESGDVEGHRAEAMRRVGDDLIARMFSPFPPAEAPPQQDDGAVAPIELAFRLTARREELATRARWDFRERRAVVCRHYAAASLVDLLGRRPADEHIRFADLAAPNHETVVRVEPELTRLGIAAVEVDFRSAPDAAPGRTVVLTDDAPELRFAADGAATPVRYRVRARFDPATTRARDRQSDWLASDTGIVVVSARRLFPPRSFTVIAGRVEFDWLDHVEITVTAPGETPRTQRLAADARSAELFLAGAGGDPLSVAVAWQGLRNEPSRADPPREVRDDILILDSPFADSLNLLVVPLPLPDIGTIVVELRTVHDGFSHQKSVAWDGADRAPQRVGLRRLRGSSRRYAQRTRLVHTDGTIDPSPWQDSDADTLVVGASAPVVVFTAAVVLLGGGPAARGSLGVEFVLQAGDERTTDVLEGDRDSATLVLVAREDAVQPVLTAREFLNSGEVRETRWTHPEALTVLPPVSA